MEPREYGELGLSSAVARLEEALRTQAEDEVLVALAETLHWAYSLDDYIAKESGNTDGYRVARNNDELGAVLAGLIYARNRATHSLVTAVELVVSVWHQSRSGGPLLYGGRRTAPAIRQDFQWRSLEALGKPPEGFEEQHGKDRLYDQYVAGRDLLDPIREGIRYMVNPA